MDLEITDHTCMLNFHNSSDLAMNEPCLEVTMWLMIDSTDASFTKIERTDSMLLSRSQKVSNVYFRDICLGVRGWGEAAVCSCSIQ